MLIESYYGLPKFIEIFNAIFTFSISVAGTYVLWRKNKAGTLTDYEKRGWRLIPLWIFCFLYPYYYSYRFSYL